jgi:threonine dehydratase
MAGPPVTIEDVRRAAGVIDGHVRRTPVMSCASLGQGVWLKAELFQRTGAFKVRGAFSRIAELTPDERACGIVTCSAGNHAAAVALAGRELGTDALVMMPSWASQAKVDATRAYGATVDLEAVDATEAFARMHAEAAETGRVIVHPFDDPAVMAGQGTVGLELCEQVEGHSGRRPGRRRRVDLGCRDGGQGPGTDCTSGRRRAGGDLHARGLDRWARRFARPAGVSIADALGPPSIGAGPLSVLAHLLDEAVVVSEEQIAEGFRFLYARAKLAVEPAAAAPVAALLAGLVEPVPGTVLVLSGGNVSPELAARLLAG